jgi:Ca-activated chloride channel family protein
MRIAALLLALAPPALANGLLEADGPVRPVAHRVRAAVHDRVAEVVVEHTFRNDGRSRLEGRYLFPLPDGATVSEFAMTMAGKWVTGEVIERGRARGIYEGIVSRQRDPGLLEQVDRGLFSARVFPIEPLQDIAIRLVYQQLLPENAGTLEFRYPLAEGRLRACEAAPVDLVIDIESTVDLRDIGSPSHEIATTRDGARRGRVTWQGPCERDFLLRLGRDPEAVRFTLLSHRGPAEDGTLLAILAPVAEAEGILPRDIVYVVDVSGSMRGDKLEQAKAALRFGVRGLRGQDRFNLIAFSTAARRFRDALAPAEDDAKEAAVAWTNALEATGGTALADALEAALRLPEDDRLKIVVLLTDGLPTVGTTSPREIVDGVATANRGRARVFVFGVGFDQNVAFLDRIAGMTRGAREYVTPDEDLEAVLRRFFVRIDRPVMTDLRLDLGEGVEEVYPRPLPDLFAGDQLVVVGRYRTPGPRAVRLTGRVHGREVSYVHEGVLAERKEIAALPRLWAERKVAFLLEQIALHGRDPELVGEVVQLGTKHSIVTPYTAGLVVEDGELDGGTVDAETAADAPFTGPSTNSSIGVGARARAGQVGAPEAAVELGLRWLARHQDPATGALGDDLEEHAFAILAFLGAGHTDLGSKHANPWARTVRAALRHLLASQRHDGSFASDVRRNAVATLAFCEAHRRTGKYQAPAQHGLAWLCRLGWQGDHLATVYCLLALRAGKHAGLEVDPDALETTRRFLALTPTETPTERAGSALARILLGEDPSSAAIQELLADLEPQADPLYAMVATLANFQAGGPAWRRWHGLLADSLVSAQREDGSWPASGGLSERRTTALNLLALEVYYRYDRVFGVR